MRNIHTDIRTKRVIRNGRVRAYIKKTFDFCIALFFYIFIGVASASYGVHMTLAKTETVLDMYKNELAQFTDSHLVIKINTNDARFIKEAQIKKKEKEQG